MGDRIRQLGSSPFVSLPQLIGHSLFLFAFLAFFALFASVAVGLTVKEPKPTTVEKDKSDDPARVKWHIFLDSLSQETRTIFPEERRPYAVADIANAYWPIDREESRSLYLSALDEAWKFTQQDKKYRPMLNYVLGSASEIDIDLGKLLTKRLLAKSNSDEKGDGVATDTALDLLDQDPQKAAQLAKAFAPSGLRDRSALWFIFQLGKIDLQLANDVYAVYLEKATADGSLPVESVLPLTGFAFGYPEYISMNDRGEAPGMVGFRGMPDLAANPLFAQIILDDLYKRITKAIAERNNAIGSDVTGRNYVIVFALEYLVPEVPRLEPGSVLAWQQLEQQAMVGVSVEQAQTVRGRVMDYRASRVRAQSYTDSPEKFDADAESWLDYVEKTVGTCQRDVLYMRAALGINYRKNYKRVEELISKIEGEKRADDIRQVMLKDRTFNDIESGELDQAESRIKKLSDPRVRSIVQISLAEAYLKKGQTSDSIKLANAATDTIDKLPEPGDRAGLLFALAAVRLKGDPVDALAILSKAVKQLNTLDHQDRMSLE